MLYFYNNIWRGNIHIVKTKTYLEWVVTRNLDLYCFCKLINGFFRTPKIEALHRLIDYFNLKNEHEKLNVIGLDDSSLDSNAWLSGFCDADASFSFSLLQPKEKTVLRVKLMFFLEQKQFSSKKVSMNFGGSSFLPVCEKIADLFDTSVSHIARVRESNVTSSFRIITSNKKSNEKVCQYFDCFPLFSSKALNYKDWRELHRIQISNYGKHYSPDFLIRATEIKKNYNSKRIIFDWSHLSQFYFFPK